MKQLQYWNWTQLTTLQLIQWTQLQCCNWVQRTQLQCCNWVHWTQLQCCNCVQLNSIAKCCNWVQWTQLQRLQFSSIEPNYNDAIEFIKNSITMLQVSSMKTIKIL